MNATDSATGLALKDTLTLAIGFIALAVSISVFWFNLSTEIRRRRLDREKAFAETIKDLADLRTEMQNLRRELGEEFNLASNQPIRLSFADRQSFLISKAQELCRNDPRVGASFEHLLLAAALADRGRIGEAIEHYAESYRRCSTRYQRAEAGRVYGRALMLGGEIEIGRQEMTDAATEFAKLAGDPDHEANAMRYEEADTYRRLFEMELSRRDWVAAATVIVAFRTATNRLTDARRTRMNLLLADCESRLARRQAPPAGEVSPRPAPPDAAKD